MTATISTEQLTKRYGHTTALDALDLEIEPGEVFGYLGPNGAGKSTTIALLLGLIRPTSGAARIFGLDVVARRAGDPPPARVRAERGEPVAVAHRRGGAAVPRPTSTARSTTPTATSSSIGSSSTLDKKIRAYSHGNRQKVLLIAAFASRADLLLLDEPTTGLDPLMEQVFRACVREARDRGQTVLLSSHILSEVEAVCDRVAMLRAGRIIETGRLDVLRGLAALRVRAELDGAAARPVARRGREQRRRRRHDGRVRRDRARWSRCCAALADAGVSHMTTREPSLEELFVSHYGDGRPTAARR